MNLEEILKRRREAVLAKWMDATRGRRVLSPLVAAGAGDDTGDNMVGMLDEIVSALAARPPASPEVGASQDADADEDGRVDEILQDHWELHRAIFQVAEEEGALPSLAECLALASCIESGIARAVVRHRDARDADLQRHSSEQLGFLAHELRQPVATARLVSDLMRRRLLPGIHELAGRLERSLSRLQDLIDQPLIQGLLDANVPPQRASVALRSLLDEIYDEVANEAAGRHVRVDMAGEDGIELKVDRRLLYSAMINLVRNAVKFTRTGGRVEIRASRGQRRTILEFEDECGGLPYGSDEDLFRPFVQKGANRNGFGLGLTIARRAVEVHGGLLQVRNLPGRGCIFRLELPTDVS